MAPRPDLISPAGATTNEMRKEVPAMADKPEPKTESAEDKLAALVKEQEKSQKAAKKAEDEEMARRAQDRA